MIGLVVQGTAKKGIAPFDKSAFDGAMVGLTHASRMKKSSVHFPKYLFSDIPNVDWDCIHYCSCC